MTVKAVCINADASTELQLEKEYFVFPVKWNHYYVSQFNNIDAHFGCYPKERFQLIEKDVWSSEPDVQVPDLDQDTFYRAQLIWRAKGHRSKPLKDYVIKPKKTHCFFWHDRKREQFCGCFPLHWFANFEPIVEQQEEVKENHIVLIERFGGQLAFF
ncbi:hypothetical protein SAMN04488574_102440 [Bacillus sp. 71mf]|nr:hypothetical protein SAMN04488574_102440 [Bacillus sp. 71mf]SFS35202.1 hypothetical protein SAMN04488145_10125 [Bacillus sp. 103mf]